MISNFHGPLALAEPLVMAAQRIPFALAKSLSWFPGHMAKAFTQLEARLPKCDVILEVRDARLPWSSRSDQLEAVRTAVPWVVVLNKADLAPRAAIKAWSRHLEEAPNSQGKLPDRVVAMSRDDRGSVRSVRGCMADCELSAHFVGAAAAVCERAMPGARAREGVCDRSRRDPQRWQEFADQCSATSEQCCVSSTSSDGFRLGCSVREPRSLKVFSSGGRGWTARGHSVPTDGEAECVPSHVPDGHPWSAGSQG
jgi:ethanolamine utilization protein EutP (predicted NTPase)